MSTIFINSFWQADANWWEAGGAAGVMAVYRPKGAASYAASKIDLSGNGNDATDGTAPTWDAVNGWKFLGTSSQFIKSNVVHAAGWTMIIQFTDYTVNGRVICGANPVGSLFQIIPNLSGSNCRYYYGNAVATLTPQINSGNVCLAANNCYQDGSAVGTVPFSSFGTPTQGVFIGANNNGGGTAQNFSTANVTAFALYDNTLTPDQVSAVSAAMAAL